LTVVAASSTEETPGAEQDEIGRFATLSFSLGHGEE